jgi:hypothetical protein
MESQRVSRREQWPGLLPIVRRCVLGAEAPSMLILPHPHTMVRPQRVGAITRTRRRRGEGTQGLPPLRWRGPMHAKVIHPACARRRGHGKQEQPGKEARQVPETAPAHDREVAGPPAHAVAHRLGGRDTLEVWGAGHPLARVVQGGTVGADEPVRDRIGERRQCMQVDGGGLLAPTERRGRPSHTLTVQVA